MSGVRWLATSPEVYAVIRARHGVDMCVHGTITRLEADHNGGKQIMTEWGLRGSALPIIKIDQREGEVGYFIAIVNEDDES